LSHQEKRKKKERDTEAAAAYVHHCWGPGIWVPCKCNPPSNRVPDLTTYALVRPLGNIHK